MSKMSKNWSYENNWNLFTFLTRLLICDFINKPTQTGYAWPAVRKTRSSGNWALWVDSYTAVVKRLKTNLAVAEQVNAINFMKSIAAALLPSGFGEFCLHCLGWCALFVVSKFESTKFSISDKFVKNLVCRFGEKSKPVLDLDVQNIKISRVKAFA